MKLLSVSMSNFKCYRGESKFYFPKRDGLYLLSGRNRVARRLEGNAVGKSTLWDAVCWCLYGKTLRGLKAGNVVSWGKKSGEVSLRFMAGKTEHIVCRKQSPNRLQRRYLSGEWVDVDQGEIDRLVGMNYACFLHCALMGQFGTFFFDLTPSEKLGLFSDILGLDVWLKASDAARLEVNRAAREEGESQTIIDQLVGRIKANQEQIESLQRNSDEYDKKQDVDCHQLKLRLATCVKLKKKADAALEKAKDRQDAVWVLENDRRRWQERMKIEREKRQSLLRNRCPTCGQKLPDRKIELAKVEREIGEIRHELNVIDRKLYRMPSGDELEKRYVLARDACSSVVSEVDRLEDQLSRRSHNPYRKQIAETRSLIRESRSKVKTARLEQGKALARQKAAEYWIKGFRDIRLWIIDQSLRELELEVNNNLQSLGLNDWTVRFDVERETKSGTLSRGFSVFIKAPGIAGEVPWESWSGGETQRLKLAGNAGLSNLIRNRRGADPRFELWDEPEQHVNPQGVEDVIGWLRDRSREYHRSVWLVSHRSLNSGQFDREYRVIREKAGSRIVLV